MVTGTPTITKSIQMPSKIKKYDFLLNMRKAILICLGQRPYSMTAFKLFFEQKPVDMPEVPPDDMYDKIEFAISCNENI